MATRWFAPGARRRAGSIRRARRTPLMPSGPMAPPAAPSWRSAGWLAATRGVARATTPCPTRKLVADVPADRQRPRLVLRPRPELRRRHRSPDAGDHDPADAAHAEEHQVDARAAAAPARGTAPPAAAQGRSPEAQRRDDGAVQGAQDQPAGRVPAIAPPSSRLHHLVPRPARHDASLYPADGRLPLPEPHGAERQLRRQLPR